jgi:peptide methionine sulfoxide reductase MsrA
MGDAEVCQIRCDPATASHPQLFDTFWKTHDDPGKGYCAAVMSSKLDKFRKFFGHR